MLANFRFLKIKISDSVQANTAGSRIFREYLRENEFLSKTHFACLSRAQVGLIHEIKNAKKSRDTTHLRCKKWRYWLIIMQKFNVTEKGQILWLDFFINRYSIVTFNFCFWEENLF